MPLDYDEIKLMAQAKRDFKTFAESEILYQRQFSEEGITIKPFHEEWVEAIENNKRAVITAFTGSGKSTVNIIYVLWKIFFSDEPFSALIVANSLDQSKKILRQLKRQFENSEYLMEYIPEDTQKAWSAKAIELEDPEGFTHRIECKPYNENIKGEHVDLVICDEAAEYEPKDVFYSSVKTRVPSQGGSLVLISTPVHENDLRAELSEGVQPPICDECFGEMEEQPVLAEERGLDVPVFVCQDCGAENVDPDIDDSVSERGFWNKTYRVMDDETGDPIFPEQFDMKKIKELKREDPESFKREYMCRVVSSEGGLIDSNDIIECFDKSESFRQYKYEGKDYYLGVDLAAAKRGDYSVYTVVEVDRETGDKVVRFMERVQGMSLPAQQNRLEQLHEIFEFKKIVVDRERYKSVLDGLKENGLPAEGQSFQSAARSQLLNKLKTEIESHSVTIPRSNEYMDNTRSLTDQLFEELDGYGVKTTDAGNMTYRPTTDHDDTVMSLAMALNNVQVNRGTDVMMASGKMS